MRASQWDRLVILVAGITLTELYHTWLPLSCMCYVRVAVLASYIIRDVNGMIDRPEDGLLMTPLADGVGYSEPGVDRLDIVTSYVGDELLNRANLLIYKARDSRLGVAVDASGR